MLHSSDELYGSDRVLLDLVPRLRERGFAIHVVLPNDVITGGALSRELRALDVPVTVWPLAVMRRRLLSPGGLLKFGWRILGDIRRLRRLTRQRSIALVYSNTSAVVSGAIFARLVGLPHVWHVHEIVLRPPLLERLIRGLVDRLGGEVIAVSQAVASWLAPSRARLTVIHNGIAEPVLSTAARAQRRRDLEVGPEDILVGWIGRVGEWKGHQVFLDVAELALTRLPRAVFVLAGGPAPGSDQLLEDLEVRVRAIGSGRIRYLGLVQDGPALAGSLDLLVACPLRPDPFPRVVEEAQWQGVPVLAVSTGGLAELVVDGVTGTLVGTADANRLVEALVAMVERAVLPEFGRQARLRAQREWGMERFVDRVGAVLERAVRS